MFSDVGCSAWGVLGHTPSGYGAISTVGLEASVLVIYSIDIILLVYTLLNTLYVHREILVYCPKRLAT